MRTLMVKAVSLALSLLTVATIAVAQESDASRPRFMYVSSPTAVPVEIRSAPLLRRKIATSLERVTMQEALDEIARQSQLNLVYSREDLPVGRRVTLKAEDLTVAAALTQVLLDTELDVLFSWNGQVAIVRRAVASVARATGAVSGRVVDSASRAGVPGVTVFVEAQRLSATTDANGAFTLRAVPVGPQTIGARRLGYRTLSRRVNVTDAATVTVDFVLGRAPTVLSEVVVTPTGERQRLEVGNSIGTIKADSVVASTLIRNMSDLLQARTPGVVVSNIHGDVGAPSKVRIRGINSMMLNNDPIVVLDGVRLLAQTTYSNSQANLGAFGGANPANVQLVRQVSPPSRLDDIDPNTIESIDVLRGPSAASLYGTEASNGVIVIKTKQGRSGDWRTNVMLDQGSSRLPNGLADSWFGWGMDPNGQGVIWNCTLARLGVGLNQSVEDGSCALDSVTHFNPQNYPRLRTYGTGRNRSASVSLSGGQERLREFLSLSLVDNLGMAKMAEIERDRIARTWNAPPPSWMVRPNTETHVTGASRTNAIVSPKFDMSITADGTYRSVLNGGSTAADFATAQLSARGPSDTLHYLPSELQRAKRTMAVKRGAVSTQANYTPWSVLQLRGIIGGDYSLRSDEATERSMECSTLLAQWNSTYACRSGRAKNTMEVFVTSVDVSAQLALTPLSWLSSRSAFGEQYTDTKATGLNVGNSGSTNLAFGTELLTPAPVATSGSPQLYSVSESRDEAATAGWYVEQTFGLRNRAYLTAGVRRDAASAFGASTNDAAPVYPKFSASWLVSEEPFFPQYAPIQSLRLRWAYGHSGNQASRRLSLHNFRLGQMYADGVTVTGLQLSQLGNADLRPERTTEWETGFDLSLFSNDRITTEVTAYRKLSKDAITSVGIPPSYGAGWLTVSRMAALSSYTSNVGSVENTGTEVRTTARVIDRPAALWELTVNWAQNRNKLVKKDSAFSSSGSAGTDFREGYPLYGYWGYPLLSYSDLNGDGVLQSTEAKFGNRVFYGGSYPAQQFTYANSLTLLRGVVRLNANVDHIDGATTRRTAGRYVNPRCLVDPSCSLAGQAAAMEAAYRDNGFIRTSSSLRLSELSATYNVSPALIHRYFGAGKSLSATLAGRNLALWTNYAGTDPNVNSYGPGEVAADDGSAVPQPRMWTLRITMGF